MAKYETHLSGDFFGLLQLIDDGILRGSASASFEDGSDWQARGVRCAVRVYERYSLIGSNRVSLSVTLVGAADSLFISAITSGGSQAILFKLNTVGEESFLSCLTDIVERYRASQ
ncbi:MAG: DUF6054 family protein [Oscillospiraceae bacterium]|jgi:hypothetical protein|nr:DUF6054 family protein [Oscillospiraceae bacterium]